MSLHNAIPAFPAQEVAATVAFYRDRLGFGVAYQHEGFARLVRDDVDGLYDEMRAAGVLHYRDPGSPTDTDFGTREFAVTDLDGNLIVFYLRR